jgi:hypothetical protein
MDTVRYIYMVTRNAIVRYTTLHHATPRYQTLLSHYTHYHARRYNLLVDVYIYALRYCVRSSRKSNAARS